MIAKLFVNVEAASYLENVVKQQYLFNIILLIHSIITVYLEAKRVGTLVHFWLLVVKVLLAILLNRGLAC